MAHILFDFNRTLFEPDTGTLMPGAHDVLTTLRSEQHALHLISRDEGTRADLVPSLGLTAYFLSIHFVDRKSADYFQAVRSRYAPHAAWYSIGDYRHEDVRYGNQAGMRTVWLQRGKFAAQEAESEFDMPWATIHELSEVLTLRFE